MMTNEDRRKVQDAMTALAKVEAYSGAVVVVFTHNYAEAGVHLHAVGEGLANGALKGALSGLMTQRDLTSSPLMVAHSEHARPDAIFLRDPAGAKAKS